jgi:hypothetical protein
MNVQHYIKEKDFLRKLCKDGFPSGNIFEYAAQQMQNYEKKRKNDLLRKATMKNSVEDLHLSEHYEYNRFKTTSSIWHIEGSQEESSISR